MLLMGLETFFWGIEISYEAKKFHMWFRSFLWGLKLSFVVWIFLMGFKTEQVLPTRLPTGTASRLRAREEPSIE